MTLVVARSVEGRIAIAADTQVTEHEIALPLRAGALKSCCLPGYLCVSYCGSPEQAAQAFRKFQQTYARGADQDDVVRFFERSSSSKGNDFIIAFGGTGKLVTIRDGRRIRSMSRTHWIGDKDAYECFREHEHRARRRFEQGRAVNAALFADEMAGSPASDLHGALRNVVLDRAVPSVGGFVTVLGNRDIGFRYSVYSDVLLDWPQGLPDDAHLNLTDKFSLVGSGENDRYSISQVSAGYYNINAVAFYVLKGKLLLVFIGCMGGSPGQCLLRSGVEPQKIAETLDEILGGPFRAMCLVMSSRSEHRMATPVMSEGHGLGLSLYCEANTMARN